ncbi:MAG: hypothetical protein IJ083_06705 [Clostridia bacterium]|nr:hypothetical protein [Clostridia bacterium]
MTDQADEILLHQEAIRAARSGRCVAGRFLPASLIPLARKMARDADVSVAFDGGFEDAERLQPCFYPLGESPSFDMRFLEITWHRLSGQVEHRALLGSLMALQIDRSYFGDLVMSGECAYLCALPLVADRLPLEWTEAGRVPIRVRVLSSPPVFSRQAGEQLHVTLASPRLDAVLSDGLRISRARACDLIRAGQVSLNHIPEERVDRNVCEGDLLSIRGHGRIRLLSLGEPNRKGRLPAELELFLSGKR